MNNPLLFILFLLSFACSYKIHNRYAKVYFEFNDTKYYPSNLNLSVILLDFGSDYEPIEPKLVALVDPKLDTLFKTSIIKITYNELGIEFLIQSNLQIPVKEGYILECGDINFDEITITEVKIQSPQIRTNIGVTIGDSRESVENKFGPSELPWTPTGYNSHGLSFELNKQEQVEKINIYKPFK